MIGEGGRTPIIGILGGGQLGRMLALAGVPLGFRFRFLDPTPDPPVRDVGEVITAAYDDLAAMDRFCDGLVVATYEFENVPVDVVRRISATVPVHPPPVALDVAQDRLTEKGTFQRLGIRTAPFVAVESRAELEAGLEKLGFPAVLKTRRFGYDGKGQQVIEGPDDLDRSWSVLGGSSLLLEGFVRFRRELSILAVRGRGGETIFYPLSQNEHRGGILSTTRAPVPDLSEGLQAEAEGVATLLLDELGYVGVLAMELFDTDEGLLANEIAPRVHNSGHWTQDGAATCQFENHLRAITGLPLGRPEPQGWSAMVNLLGHVPDRRAVLTVPGTHLHLYGKEARPRRKVGHVNVRGTSPEELESRVRDLQSELDGQATQISQSP